MARKTEKYLHAIDLKVGDVIPGVGEVLDTFAFVDERVAVAVRNLDKVRVRVWRNGALFLDVTREDEAPEHPEYEVGYDAVLTDWEESEIVTISLPTLDNKIHMNRRLLIQAVHLMEAEHE